MNQNIEKELLTIGIPSFRRVESLRSVIDSILDSLSDEVDVKIIIVNDSGRERDTIAYREMIQNSAALERVPLIEHLDNLGYPSALLRLFEECESEYLFITSDDDLIDFGDSRPLMTFLRRVQPDICSTQFLRNGKILRV